MATPVHGNPKIDQKIESIFQVYEKYIAKSSFKECRNLSGELHVRIMKFAHSLIKIHRRWVAEKFSQSAVFIEEIEARGPENYRINHPDGTIIIDALTKYPTEVYLGAVERYRRWLEYPEATNTSSEVEKGRDQATILAEMRAKM